MLRRWCPPVNSPPFTKLSACLQGPHLGLGFNLDALFSRQLEPSHYEKALYKGSLGKVWDAPPPLKMGGDQSVELWSSSGLEGTH